MLCSPFAADISNSRLWQTLLCVAVVLLALISVHAENISVCEVGCDYTSITAGIAVANPGDILEVSSGTYSENVDVTKPITLLGIDTGSGRPVVNASYRGSAMILSADGVMVDGFELRSAVGNPFIEWAGINVVSSNNVISNNLALDNDNGILLSGSANNTITGNNATSNTNGIRLKGSNSNNLSANYLSSNNWGLIAESSADNILDGNRATNNDYGILLISSEGNALKDNLMYENSYNFGADGLNDVSVSNLVDNKPIYFLIGASGNMIDSSSRAGTVYCFDCSNLTIKDLTMDNNQNGIFLSNTTHSNLANNRLINNSYGIRLVFSSKNIIRNSELSYNLFDGLNLDSSDNNTIESIRAFWNNDYGLRAFYSNNNSMITNKISNNNNGIAINYSRDNLISRISISSNTNNGLMLRNSSYNNISLSALNKNLRGAWLIHSSQNDIENNDISANVEGIRLEFSENNNVTKNKIRENSYGIFYDAMFTNIMSDNSMLGNEKDQEDFVSSTTGRAPVAHISHKSKKK